MNKDILNKYIKAGKIAAQVRREGAVKLAVAGTPFLETMDFCENRIIELGGGIAWAQMGVNQTAAHFCPNEDEEGISQEGDVIKIDIGVHLDGWIADNAMTVEVNSNKYANMIKAAKNALKAATKLVRPGVQLWELGEAQMSEAEALGFTTIKNLSGHTLGQYKVHGGISIPSFNNKDKHELKEDQIIAIEPFVTDGDGFIKEKNPATVFMMKSNAAARTPYARKIIQEIAPRKGLPFTAKDLTRKFGKGIVALGLRELHRTGVITPHPPLVESSGGIVTQFEHSMVVQDKPLVFTKHQDDQW